MSESYLYGKKLIEESAKIAATKDQKLSIQTCQIIGQKVLEMYEYFDGEPICTEWFACQILKHAGRVS